MRLAIAAAGLALLLNASCASSGAAEGATRGAFQGAVSSGIVAAVFGGDVGKSMQYGAVGGAVTGGMAGAANESRQRQHEQQRATAQKNAELERENRALRLREELIAKIGMQNTEAISELIQCQHEQALVHVRRASTSDDRNERLASLWIEATVALDRRDLAAASAVYPTLVAQDEEVSSVDEAQATAMDLLAKLEDTRAEFGLPRRCQ